MALSFSKPLFGSSLPEDLAPLQESLIGEAAMMSFVRSALVSAAILGGVTSGVAIAQTTPYRTFRCAAPSRHRRYRKADVCGGQKSHLA